MTGGRLILLMPLPDLSLPVYEIAPALGQVLRQGNRAIVTAPTGSGKTTQIPQLLLREGWSRGQVLVLQPRRLAARLVAARVAWEMDAPLGGVVGFQTRHESQVSDATVIRFLTEALLLRMLRSSPLLEGVGAVILDEFHERSVSADAALALLQQLQQRRPDLKLLVMSATLDTEKLAAYLQCPVLSAHGRLFPVQVNYLERPGNDPPWELAARALDELLQEHDQGDVLIFMPGAYEIRRTIEACRRIVGSAAQLLPLYGELPVVQQDAAVAPGRERKVIVATNVAQTSITIPGVRHVIDSGLARVHRYDPRRGINVLMIEPISQAAAEQRTGRAGRVAAGHCFRLWTAIQQRQRPAQDTPEIQRLDLAEVVLQLLGLGVAEVAGFPWLDPPAALALEQAQGVLGELGAIDAVGKLTAVGTQMARVPAHPRLGRMLLEARRRNCLERACLWAALVSERDVLIRGAGAGGGVGSGRFREAALEQPISSDFMVLEEACRFARQAHYDIGRCQTAGVHALAAREVERTRRLLAKAAGVRGEQEFDAAAGGRIEDVIACLLAAFPDHVAARRGAGNLSCAVVAGRRGELDSGSVAVRVGAILPVEIRELGAGQGVRTVLSLASELPIELIEEVRPGELVQEKVVLWREQKQVAEQVEQMRYRDLVISERVTGEPDPQQAQHLVAQEVIRQEMRPLEQWDEQVEQWLARTRCVAQWFPERRLLTYDEGDLQIIVEEICAGASRMTQVRQRPCLDKVRGALSWEDQQFVEKMAPDRLDLPRGGRMKIHYQAGAPPRGRAKIQELYGLTKTPHVAGGRQKLVLEILGPNYRPLQMTDDLENFWKDLYPVLKKELSRKYPRHEWR